MTIGLLFMVALGGFVVACLALLLANGAVTILVFLDERPRRRPKMPPSLAAHIAEHEAASIDAEWAAICRATGGGA